MNDPKIALKKIEQLLSSWNQNPEMAAAHYAAIKEIICQIDGFCGQNEVSDYTHENISKARFHINAMFGADIDNGHDFSSHYSWALGSISILGDDLCLGLFNY